MREGVIQEELFQILNLVEEHEAHEEPGEHVLREQPRDGRRHERPRDHRLQKGAALQRHQATPHADEHHLGPRHVRLIVVMSLPLHSFFARCARPSHSGPAGIPSPHLRCYTRGLQPVGSRGVAHISPVRT